MIAKNEEDFIAQAIKSVLPIICETILVDTGSTDRTVEIAESLGAKVFHRPWDNDFAAPRNLSIEKATGDWILVLDADEAISPKDLAALHELTLEPNNCYEFNQRHYTNDQRLSDFKPVRGENPEFERNHGGYFESALVRLFPHKPGLEYRGRVHELVEHSIYQNKEYKIVRSEIRLHHYGHTEEVRKKKNKATLYTPLGTEKLKDNPSDWKSYFELGVEHNVNGKYEESVIAFTKSISLNPKYVPTWSNIGYVLCELKRYQEAEKCLITAIDLDPRGSDAYCNLGVVYLRVSAFPKAEACFRRAIAIDPLYVNAFCNLAKSLAFMGRISESVNIFQRALELLPQCTGAKIDLASLYMAHNMFSEAKGYLISALTDNPEASQTYYLMAQVHKVEKNTKEAVRALEKFCEIEEKSAATLPPDAVQRVMIARQECEQMKRALSLNMGTMS